MSEEETLIDDTPVEEAATDEVVESTEVEATAEEGERPEWLKDKYKTVEDQAKAYNDAEKKLGGFSGSPEGE